MAKLRCDRDTKRRLKTGVAVDAFMHKFELLYHGQHFQRTSLERHRPEECQFSDRNPSAQAR